MFHSNFTNALLTHVSSANYETFPADKVLHIKTSAVLAITFLRYLYFRPLAYGITIFIGLLKEFCDSFTSINPDGIREIDDLRANEIGASIIYGTTTFDERLEKFRKKKINNGSLFL